MSQNSKSDIFSPSDIPTNSNSSPRASSCMSSSLREKNWSVSKTQEISMSSQCRYLQLKQWALSDPRRIQNKRSNKHIELEQRTPAHAKPDLNDFRPQKWNLKAHMWCQLSPFPGSGDCNAAPLWDFVPVWPTVCVFFLRPTPLGFRQVVQHVQLHVAWKQ